MTRILPSGLEVKSGHIPKQLAPNLTPEQREFVMLGHNVFPFVFSVEDHPGTRMTEAVLAITDAFHDPAFAGDEKIIRYKQWLAGFEVKVREYIDWGRGEEPVLRFIPRPGDAEDVDELLD